MVGANGGDRDRRVGNLVLAIAAVAAVIIIALALPGIGGATIEAPGGIGDGPSDEDTSQATDSTGGGERTVGEGLGADAASPMYRGEAPPSAFDPSATNGTEGSRPGGTAGSGSAGESSPSTDTQAGASEQTTGSSSPKRQQVGSTNPFQTSSTRVQFIVETTGPPGYWRVDAYDRYTGQGWVRTGEPAPYTGEQSPEGPVDQRVSQTITLQSPATALPARWQPARITGLSDSQLRVTPTGGIHTATSLPAGTEYTVESYVTRPAPSALRSAGKTYPRAVQESYTAVPETVPDRVHELGTDLTTDAETSYDAAVAIESYLRTSKAYSTNVSHAAGENPVDQYLFEMDAGYCQYSAASMAVLLRTQGIPARYVTGYTPGKRIATEGTTDRYRVTNQEAHAWTEVYFPGYGWQRFDPTPPDRLNEEAVAGDRGQIAHAPTAGDAARATDTTYNGTHVETPGWERGTDAQWRPKEVGTQRGAKTDNTTADTEGRMATDGQAADDTSSGSRNAGESGTTPGTQDETATDTDDATTADRNENDTDAASEYTIHLSTTPPVSPGTELTVTVTQDGQPVTGESVTFNGDLVGTTDEDGNVTGVVPYSDNLTVELQASSVQPQSITRRDAMMVRTLDQTRQTGAVKAVPPQQLAATPATREVDVVSEMTVDTATEPLRAGSQTTVRATIRGDPVPEAQITVAGKVVGQTSQQGELSIQVPETVTESVTITASRGNMTAETTVPAGPLTVTVTPQLPVALPSTTGTVRTTIGPEPVSGTTIKQDGTQHGTTDSNGTTAITYPMAAATTVTATYNGATTTQRVEGLIRNLVGIGIVGLGIIGLGGYQARQRGLTGRRIGQRLAAGIRAVVTTIIGIGVRAATLVERVARLFGHGITGLFSALRRLPNRVQAWWRHHRPPSLPELISTLVVGGINRLQGLVFGLIFGIKRWRQQANKRGTQASSGTAETATQRAQSVRAIWAAFVRRVLPQGGRTITPGAVARRAIDQGFPPTPVRRLTAAFRAVAYGQASDQSKVQTAQQAYDTITQTTATDEAEPDNEPAAHTREQGDETTRTHK